MLISKYKLCILFILLEAKQTALSTSVRSIDRGGETDFGIFDADNDNKTDTNERHIGFHHNQKFNALFGDGHVENMLQSEPYMWRVGTN